VKLSPRQEQVAALVVQGYSAKRIASMLKSFDPATGASRPLSARTVQEYICEIAAKIGGGPASGPGSHRVRISTWWMSQERAS
jgi:DNA-binding NarL/FixJ family response regulator